MQSRRDFFKVMAAAPAVLLVKQLPAEYVRPIEGVLNPAPDDGGDHPFGPRPSAQNLSMDELRQAFLHKWIPRN